jgi:hypothetical protein
MLSMSPQLFDFYDSETNTVLSTGIDKLSAQAGRLAKLFDGKTIPRAGKNAPISYAGYHFLPEIIFYPVWLYFRFPLSLRMVEEMLAARGIEVTYETVRSWALKFGQDAARRIRARTAAFGGTCMK